jgi:glycosyltransferase involved in cell wall biosynthesis
MKPYVLYVGNAYPHKNLEKLLIAFSKTNLSGAHLVLVGKIDYFYGRLVSLARERGIKNVIFAGHVEEEDLGAVYEEASLYAFPSLYEGFGIPPLEAMAKKVPVISSDHPCMREILGDSALFFDGKREESIGAALKKVFQDEFWRNNLVARGEEQVKKYSWALMAQKTQEIYVECMRKSH